MERRESISSYGDKEERLMGSINTNLNKLEKIQEEGNEIIAMINAIHDKYQSKCIRLILIDT
jgi:hypothetical protein